MRQKKTLGNDMHFDRTFEKAFDSFFLLWQAILFDFRSQEEERKRMRHAEKDKHKESMLKKLSKSKKNKKYSGEVCGLR